MEAAVVLLQKIGSLIENDRRWRWSWRWRREREREREKKKRCRGREGDLYPLHKGAALVTT